MKDLRGKAQQRETELAVELARRLMHQLNNSLTAIVGWAEIGQAELTSGQDVSRALGKLYEAAIQGQGLTRTWLELTRVRDAADQRSPDVAEDLRRCAGIVQGLAPPAIRFSLDVANALGPVRGEPRAARVVLLQLLLQAMDFCEVEGSVHVVARADAGMVTVEVKAERKTDSSDADAKPQIRDAELVRALGGKSSAVLKRPGQLGVELLLPVGSALAAARSTQPSRAPAGAQEVLVLDADESTRQLIAACLRSAGHRVETRSSAADVADWLAGHQDAPALLVVDADLLDLGAAVPWSGQANVLWLTAQDSLPHAGPVLRKPFSVADLLAAVQKHGSAS